MRRNDAGVHGVEHGPTPLSPRQLGLPDSSRYEYYAFPAEVRVAARTAYQVPGMALRQSHLHAQGERTAEPCWETLGAHRLNREAERSAGQSGWRFKR